jgi:hypothetical protein
VRLESEPILAVGSFDLEVSRGGCENASASGLGIDDELGGTLRRRFEEGGQVSARRGREPAEDGSGRRVELIIRRRAGGQKKVLRRSGRGDDDDAPSRGPGSVPWEPSGPWCRVWR